MKRLGRLHIPRLHTSHIAMRLLFTASGSLLLVLCLSLVAYLHYDRSATQSHTPVRAVVDVEQAKMPRLVAEPSLASPDPVASAPATPRLVDRSSAGPEKLTYNEDRSLVIIPASLSTSVGAVGTPQFQITADNGGSIQFPQASNTGGVYFPARTEFVGIPQQSGPYTQATWTMQPDARLATPGTYTVTFVAWSSDRQIRYNGSVQLIVTPPPGQ